MAEPVLPRYTTGSTTGWPIPPTLGPRHGRFNRPPPVIWYIHDRLVGYHVVEQYSRNGSRRDPEERARKRCAELNAEYENWLRDQGTLP